MKWLCLLLALSLGGCRPAPVQPPRPVDPDIVEPDEPDGIARLDRLAYEAVREHCRLRAAYFRVGHDRDPKVYAERLKDINLEAHAEFSEALTKASNPSEQYDESAAKAAGKQAGDGFARAARAIK